MRRSVLQVYLLCLFCFLGQISNAQKNTSFFEKWSIGQLNANKVAQTFTAKYPDIKHTKVNYKSFYDSISDKEISLDMFIEVPKGKGPFPVVIFIHGGGFLHGDKSNFTPQTFAVAEQGIVGITIEYRLVGHGGTQTLFMEDVMDAIDFVRVNAEKHKINFSKMGLAGGSAGGYLSALAAMRTSECCCYVGYNGVYDLTGKKFPGFLGVQIMENSPVFQVKQIPPATLLLHGKADTTVPCEESQLFAEAIRANGGSAELILYDGQKHAFFNREPYLSITTDALVKHVVKVLLSTHNRHI